MGIGNGPGRGDRLGKNELFEVCENLSVQQFEGSGEAGPEKI